MSEFLCLPKVTSTRVTARLAVIILPFLSSIVRGKLALKFRGDTTPQGVNIWVMGAR